MKCSVFVGTGNYHKTNALGCEDFYTTIEKDGLSILVICDGAGGKKFGAVAAKEVSDVVAGYLYENFDKLYYLDSSDAKRRIVQKIDNHLRAYSVSQNVQEKELACTIMAVAMDSNQRCICLHLGDGIVLHYKYNQSIPKIISSPMNGLSTKFTFVTMNCDLNQYLQFYRWKENTKGTFLLMTDGAQEHFRQAQKRIGDKSFIYSLEKLNELQTLLDSCSPMDDYTCGIICCDDLNQ